MEGDDNPFGALRGEELGVEAGRRPPNRAPGLTGSKRTLLGAPGLTTGNKDVSKH